MRQTRWTRRHFFHAGFVSGVLSSAAPAALAQRDTRRFLDLPDPSFHFNTFFVSWGGVTTPEFLKFLRAAKPEIVQVCFYGPMFHGYADNPASTGYPMQLPVAGQREALEAQRKVIQQVHELGSKVVAHFQIVNVIHKGGGRANNFVDFYEKRWPTDILGPKPHADYRELVQRDARGEPIVRPHFEVDYLGFCPSSPYAREAHRRMLKVALDAGVDGIITNYNYRWSCLCPYCQGSFKKYLDAKFSPAELKKRFGIPDLAAHRFERIFAELPGYPDPQTARPLDWEAMRWGAASFKEAWDNLLIHYGRGLKPDLILATWNHLGDLDAFEERAFTPLQMWGRGENYFWYSGGYGPTKLAGHKAGDGWLDCLYIREFAEGKPFLLGKYESIRMRNTIAEGVATGGSGMGLQIQYRDPAGFDAGARYLRFLREHRDLYWPAESYAEAALVFPRQALHSGQKEAVDAFRAVGNALIDEHVLLDVLVDEKLTPERLTRYPLIILPAGCVLSEPQTAMIEEHNRKRGGVLTLATPDVGPALEAVRGAARRHLSTFEAPWTVRVSAFTQPGRLILHLVNYNRDEAKAASLQGPAAECPIAAEGIGVNLHLPGPWKVKKVTLLSPDEAPAQTLEAKLERSRLRFRIPRLVVYGVVEIRY